MNLIDTSVVLPALWKTTKKVHLELLEVLSEEEVPAISVITRFEVLAGTIPEFLKSNRELLNVFAQLEVSADIADLAGHLFSEWSKKGRRLAANDLLIGATAVQHSLVLVSKNKKHFPYLKQENETTLTYSSQKGRRVSETVYFLAP